MLTLKEVEQRKIAESNLLSLDGSAMKPKVKMLISMVGLMVPYVAFVLYRAFTHPEHPFAGWFLYVAPGYFFGSIALLMVLNKKFQRRAPAPTGNQKHSAARAVRRLGYIFLLSPVAYLLTGGLLKKPNWETVLGFSWACFLSWACFRIAKKNEVESHQSAA
jgi:hypothetical protein